jgi:hypothetical protein
MYAVGGLKMAKAFQEDNGNTSSMRVMCFLSLVASMVFACLTVLGKAPNDGVIITFGFLVAAFAPKAVQKFAETKVNA